MVDEDLSQPWVCEETDPFTPRIRYFDLPKRIRMPSHVKTYDGSEDPKDHLKIFQAASKVERWTMPTWCHMFNSTLTGNARVWFDDLLPESIDSYDDLKEAFLRFKIEIRDAKGAPEVMRILGFMHGITNPELIKHLRDKIPKSVDKMWKITITFLRGEVEAGNHERKKTFPSWKQQDVGHRQNFKKGGFKNQQRPEKRQNRFALLTKTQKEILAQDKGKKAVAFDKRVEAKQWEGPSKGGKEGRSHKKGQATSNPDGEEDRTEGPMVIEAEVGGHLVHRMYVDGGASSEILYEYCFKQLRPEIRNQMVPATTYLVGFSREIIWPMGQVSLLVKIGDEEHSTSAWMNFMVVRSHSQWNNRKARLRNDLKARTQQPMVDQGTKEKIQVAIHLEYSEQTVAIGSTLTEEGQKKLCGLLRQNLDIFAWKPADMTGVPRHIAEHRLNVREGCFPDKQNKKGQAS
ncbi:hypothetical protein Tco_0664384 [Tanacetum coccineum]